MTNDKRAARWWWVGAGAVVLAAACGDDSAAGGAGTGGTSGGADADAATTDAASGGGGGGGADPAGGGTCEMAMCDYTCSADCMVECLGGRCTAECPEGGCTMDADFEAVAAFTCDGGGCSVDCDGASDCTVDCAGGGCTVGCDGDSRCKVSCGEAGDRCMVTCEAGSLASCDNDNCEIAGCEVCDKNMVDADYQPSLEPGDYTTTIDNPLFPLPVGAKWVYDAPGEIITVEVLAETYTTVTGVECVVVHDQVTDKEGVLIEDTKDWYAQDLEGNVWYFGEDTAEYVNGVKANTRGSWEAGVDGALPGKIAHAITPKVGTSYRQEYYRCEAEDMGEILAIGESVTVPAGTYEECIRVRDYSVLDPAANEHKLFCPGVGVVLVEEAAVGAASGEPVETLTSVEGL
jgi:hypothetical protein